MLLHTVLHTSFDTTLWRPLLAEKNLKMFLFSLSSQTIYLNTSITFSLSSHLPQGNREEMQMYFSGREKAPLLSDINLHPLLPSPSVESEARADRRVGCKELQSTAPTLSYTLARHASVAMGEDKYTCTQLLLWKRERKDNTCRRTDNAECLT